MLISNAEVTEDYIKSVVKYQDKSLIRVGLFDPLLVQNLMSRIPISADEITISVMTDCKLPDGSKSGLLVIQCGEKYCALGGLRE